MNPAMRRTVALITGYSYDYVRQVLAGFRNNDQILSACNTMVALEDEKNAAFAAAVVATKSLVE